MELRLAFLFGLTTLAQLVISGKLPSVYTPRDPTEFANVALVREALTKIGMSSDDVKVELMMSKLEQHGTAHIATFINNRGQECTLEFKVDNRFVILVPEMPYCIN